MAYWQAYAGGLSDTVLPLFNLYDKFKEVALDADALEEKVSKLLLYNSATSTPTDDGDGLKKLHDDTNVINTNNIGLTTNFFIILFYLF